MTQGQRSQPGAGAPSPAAGQEPVETEILQDPGIYPPDEVMAKLFADTADTPRVTRMQNRIWTRIKTGT